MAPVYSVNLTQCIPRGHHRGIDIAPVATKKTDNNNI